MAAPVGGQFVFLAGVTPVNLGLNNGLAVFPSTVAGALNIEVFSSVTTGVLPVLDPGWNAGVIVSDTVAGDAALSIVDNLLTGGTLQLFGGNYTVADSVTGSILQHPAQITAGSGGQTVIGASGDTLIGGSGGVASSAQILDASAGQELVTAGTGSNFAIYGGVGDVVLGNSAATSTTSGQIVGAAGSSNNSVAPPGDRSIALGAAGNYTVASALDDTITGIGSAANAVIAGAGDDFILLTGDTGNNVIIGAQGMPFGNPSFGRIINADTIITGSGNSTVVAGGGDVLSLGSGTNQIIAAGVRMLIGVGASGTDVIALAPLSDVTAVAGNANVAIAGGGEDAINLTGNTGNDLIIGAPGSGPAGQGITVGGGATAVDARAGGISLTLGAAGSADVTGSSATTVPGGAIASGDQITGSSGANLNYNPGTAGGDLINLAGSTGSATINAFSGAGGQLAKVNDTIIAGNGSDSVWGGGGDRIGVAGSALGGIHLWDHSTTVAGAAVAFGTNDAVSGSSTATVTVTNFATGTDNLFYQDETSATNASIVMSATATTVQDVASSIVTLPDGTVMTLVGVTPVALGTANAGGTLFKP